MKTESQEFLELQKFIPSYSGDCDRILARLTNLLDGDLDVVFNDMYEKLGNETTDEAVEEYLQDTDHICDILGFDFMEYDSKAEQQEEEWMSFEEVAFWDDK